MLPDLVMVRVNDEPLPAGKEEALAEGVRAGALRCLGALRICRMSLSSGESFFPLPGVSTICLLGIAHAAVMLIVRGCIA